MEKEAQSSAVRFSVNEHPIIEILVVIRLPLTVLLLLMWDFVACAQFTFVTNNGVLTITGYTGPSGHVIIPDSTNGMTVATIAARAFGWNEGITSVAIPDSVTNLGNHAFVSCTNLASITMPNGVKKIEYLTFKNCTALTNISIPNSVTTIEGSAFSFCTSLDNVAIPNSVIKIEGGAFESCTSLRSVTMGNSVASIGDQAFESCFSLSSVTIPSSVTNIGAYAFFNCTKLATITVDAANSAYSSTNGVLFNKSRTELIQYPPSKVASYYMIPDTVTNIENSAFESCASLTNVTIPGSVIRIGNRAFAFDAGLNSIVIPSSVTSISWETFEHCTSLNRITIPGSVTDIGFHAFYECHGLSGVYFRGNAPDPGVGVFEGDNDATVYYLPGTANWETTFADRPTALWLPWIQTSDGGFGVRTNQFGFNISWASGMAVAVDACTDPANPVWTPLQTNTLTGDTLYFSDPQWTNHPARFYRLRWP